MGFLMLVAGLSLSTAGAVVVAITDAWLARSMLIYLDAVEANVTAIVHTLRAGGMDANVTGMNLKRDRGQDRARAIKTIAWFVLAAGFGLQLAAAFMASSLKANAG
jgi:1,4-dihydroxy-2-naphthoate octaprenyltransferase